MFIVNCPPGYKSDTLGTRCEICPLGTYQPHHNETTCYPCSTPLSTEQTGSTAIQQCLSMSFYFSQSFHDKQNLLTQF